METSEKIITFLSPYFGGVEITTNIVASGYALIFTLLLSALIFPIVRIVNAKIFSKCTNVPSYQDRIAKLASTLQSSSAEVDSILSEIGKVTLERQKAAETLKLELDSLGKSEQEMKERINALKSVPLPVAEHFAKLLETGEKRSAKRDYLLFGAGAFFSVFSSLVLKAYGIA